MPEERRQYEISFLVKNEDGAAALVRHIKDFGTEIVSEGGLEKIELSYPIKKADSAYAGTLVVSIRPEDVTGIRDALNLDGDVLRFFILTPGAIRERSAQVSARPAYDSKPARPRAQAKPQPETALSNDLLEEKLEEILR